MGKSKTTNKPPTVAITGASGYIGKVIINELERMGNLNIVALAREVSAAQQTSEKVTWYACDFFSVEEVEDYLDGVDYAIYHSDSILYPARLTQGNLKDMDFMSADNFAQAAKKKSVKQIVYLTGLKQDLFDLSNGFKSQLEVEKVLSSYGVPVTTVKVRLIEGPQSSLPIALMDIINGLTESIGNKGVYDKTIYIDRPEFGKVPFFPKGIDTIEGKNTPRKSMWKISKKTKELSNQPMENNVRSVQRLYLPEGKNAIEIALFYFKWLADFIKIMIKVELDENYICRIFTTISKEPLLVLTYAKEKSHSNRAIFYITGGKLAKTNGKKRGRLEFRQIQGTNECIAAIHDYTPSLPWIVYKYIQANIHLWVMYRFNKKLKAMAFAEN